MKREARKGQFVQMYAGQPHFWIKAVPLAEIHQLQVRLKRGIIVEQFGCFNSDVWDEADLCTFFKRHWKMHLVHAFFSVRSGETFAKNNQLPLPSKFKDSLVENELGFQKHAYLL